MALTRQRIIDSVLELSAGRDARPVTVADVSRHSGVSPATIYRHFPDRAALIHAAAMSNTEAGVDDPDAPWTLAVLRQHLVALWRDLEQNLVVVREALTTEAGRELRVSRFVLMQQAFEAGLRSAGVDPAADDARRAVAAISTLTGATTFLDLHDRQGLSAEQAADVAAWSAARLLEHLDVDPASFRLVDPADASRTGHSPQPPTPPPPTSRRATPRRQP